ncbi:MAG: hypothetical protein GXP27_14265 [Planctomycetes bacterium]|nr:hypothetical protein [Planctomycetota bacterium]
MFETYISNDDIATVVMTVGLNLLVQSTLLIAVGLVASRLLRRRGAAVQSAVLRFTLASVLICPVVTLGLTWAGVEGVSLTWKLHDTVARPTETNRPAVALTLPITNHHLSSSSGDLDQGFLPSELALASDPPMLAAETITPVEAAPTLPADEPPQSERGRTLSFPTWLGVLLSATWIGVSSLLLARLAIAYFLMARYRRQAAPADQFSTGMCHHLAATMNVISPPLLVSTKVKSPCLVGWMRPAILVPAECKSDEASLRDILTHELAHLKRGDCLWNLLGQLATALIWPQPLAWLLVRQIIDAADDVCDDLVVHHGLDRSSYANTLVDVATQMQLDWTAQTVGVGMAAFRSSLGHRVTRIMDTSRSLSIRTRIGAVIGIVMMGTLLTLGVGLIGAQGKKAIAKDQQRREDDSGVATPKESVEETTLGDDSPVANRQISTKPRSYSGRVETPQGEPIAGAKIWLAVTSYESNSEKNRENREGLLRELGTADEQGRFEVVLDAVMTQEIRKRLQFSQTRAQLVATAEGRGLDWMPLDVFEDNPSEKRDMLAFQIDRALGDGRFASRALKLRPESQPVRGRLVDLEGQPLPKVTVLVESLNQPDVPRLLKAFEMSWTQEMYESLSVGVGGLARSELQKFIPPVTTDENGEFEIRGIGDDQLVTLVFDADRVEARPVSVLGREMETVSLPQFKHYPGGAKYVFVGRDFTYAVGPSVPVEGVVTDYDTGQPVASVLVSVERLFKQGARLRLDTRHMRAVTDGQGRFRITGMPPGEGHVLEVVPRKSEPFLPMTAQDVSLSIEDGDAKRIEIQVKRGIWIEGRVTDKQSGEPVSATVDYMALEKNPHALDKLALDHGWLEQRYRTDSDGRYRVLGLPGRGVLLVKSQVPGYPLAVGAETIDGYDASGVSIPTSLFRLPVRDWHLVKQIDPASDAISFTSDLVFDAGVSIPGRVVGPRGKPISDLHVLGQTELDGYWRPKYQDKVRLTDRFTVNGYDGKGPRQLFFKNKDETLVGQYRLEGDAPEEIVVTLGPSVRVTGRLIEIETDLPAARYFLNCEKCTLSNEKYPPVKFSIHWCYTDDEGRFDIKGLTAGLVYKMNAVNATFTNVGNRFTIDLTAAKPGDVIELGDVTGPDSEGDVND